MRASIGPRTWETPREPGRSLCPLGVFPLSVWPFGLTDKPSPQPKPWSGLVHPARPSPEGSGAATPLGAPPPLAGRRPSGRRTLADPPQLSRVPGPPVWFPSPATEATYALPSNQVKGKAWLVFAAHPIVSRASLGTPDDRSHGRQRESESGREPTWQRSDRAALPCRTCHDLSANGLRRCWQSVW